MALTRRTETGEMGYSQCAGLLLTTRRMRRTVEEAAEVWMACEYETDDQAAEEISQLLYHLQVMMVAKGLRLEDVYKYL